MPTMPDKPDTWAKIWLALSNPLWQGVIMSIIAPSANVVPAANQLLTFGGITWL